MLLAEDEELTINLSILDFKHKIYLKIKKEATTINLSILDFKLKK